MNIEQQSAWAWSEKAIASLYWSDTHTVWKWGVTRQTGQEWALWASGEAPSFRQAALSMAHAFEDLANSEGEPF